jgi:hypothetical protein
VADDDGAPAPGSLGRAEGTFAEAATQYNSLTSSAIGCSPPPARWYVLEAASVSSRRRFGVRGQIVGGMGRQKWKP